MTTAVPAAPPKRMRFTKDLIKVWSDHWKAGVEVEAWPSEHIPKCHNVRLVSNPSIAMLAVPDHHLEEIKTVKP